MNYARRNKQYRIWYRRLIKNDIDMKHQIYALATALIITIIGIIVTIDYFSGINKEVYKQIEVLKTDIAELKNKVVNI